jgi:hypothetical protein
MNPPPARFVCGAEKRSAAPPWEEQMRDTVEYRGSSVRELPRANRTYGRGRVCEEPECGTRLSIYNKSSRCWQHEPVRPYFERGRKPKREAA